MKRPMPTVISSLTRCGTHFSLVAICGCWLTYDLGCRSYSGSVSANETGGAATHVSGLPKCLVRQPE